MTNFEKIKQMSIEELVKVLCPDERYKNIADEKYCTEICPCRGKDREPCPFDDEKLPCVGLSLEFMTFAWLNAEAKENG